MEEDLGVVPRKIVGVAGDFFKGEPLVATARGRGLAEANSSQVAVAGVTYPRDELSGPVAVMVEEGRFFSAPLAR